MSHTLEMSHNDDKLLLVLHPFNSLFASFQDNLGKPVPER